MLRNHLESAQERVSLDPVVNIGDPSGDSFDVAIITRDGYRELTEEEKRSSSEPLGLEAVEANSFVRQEKPLIKPSNIPTEIAEPEKEISGDCG